MAPATHQFDATWADGIDANTIDDRAVDGYRTNGFIRVNGILKPQDVDRFRQAALEVIENITSYRKDAVLDQRVNVWRHHAAFKELTLSPRIATVAEKLSGVSLRLWHDQLLIKTSGDSAATEFHQDQPYWPHRNSSSPLTAWIALVDVPVECGCMSFLPGSQGLTEVPRHELEHQQGLFDLVPELRWRARVTVPLRAGDCTFHHGRTAHYAGPNRTDRHRIAHAIIYIDANSTFSGAKHVITDPLRLNPGDPVDGDLFPTVAQLTKEL